jgi:hypothetical protein
MASRCMQDSQPTLRRSGGIPFAAFPFGQSQPSSPAQVSDEVSRAPAAWLKLISSAELRCDPRSLSLLSPELKLLLNVTQPAMIFAPSF